MFDVQGKTAVITGGGGILFGEIARAVAKMGVNVAVLDLKKDAADKVRDEINDAGGRAMSVEVNVLDKKSVQSACDAVLKEFGKIDILMNGAGGNKKEATATEESPFFDLPDDAVRWVFDLNFIGTLIPCQVFGKVFAEQGDGIILNTSSMAAMSPLTKVIAYSAAKAAISNFTQWLAVYMSQNFSKKIRVNAIAPGFFLTEQNRFLLTDEKTGKYTPRGQLVIDHTPVSDFGKPEDLVGTVAWLISPAASFVHGAVIPIDGGFSAFSGV